jgi:hypothetical protein
MSHTDSSTQTESWDSSFFKFNPTTDPFQPDPDVEQSNFPTMGEEYIPSQDNFDFTTGSQYHSITQDLNFDFPTLVPDNHAPMAFMPMNEQIIMGPTIESVDFSTQMLWAEHHMKTRHLEE